MSDPLDYGDRFPSDSGDVKPPDKTDFAAEVDYIVKRLRKTKPSPDDSFKPDFLRPHLDIQERPAHLGVVVKKKNALGVNEPPTFEVLRQDGRLGEVITTKKPGVYHQVELGEPVAVVKLQEQDASGLVGQEKQLELPVLELGLPSDTAIPGPTVLPFTVKLNETGIDVADLVSINNGIQVKKAAKALYHIEWNLAMFTLNPADTANIIDVQTGCLTAPTVQQGTVLSFHRKAGLVAGGEAGAPPSHAQITLECGVGNYMPYQKENNLPGCTWSPNPILAGGLEVRSWLKMTTGSGGGGSTWLTHGNARLRYKFPNTIPTKDRQALVIERMAAGSDIFGQYNCIQLAHGPEGVTGTVNLTYNAVPIGTFSFVGGICTAAPGLFSQPLIGGVACDDNTLQDWNPCP